MLAQRLLSLILICALAIYKRTAAFGHFGLNTIDMPWEKTDKVDELLRYFNK